jgi:2-phospho-L-lactate guanylyltransferase
MTSDAIVVPLKRFDIAKTRLRRDGATGIDDVARELARGVVQSCSPRHVVVLSESDEVSAFAADLGAEVVRSDATSLNDAVQRAYAQLAPRFSRLIIAHGDLRFPSGLGKFTADRGVTIVTDRHGRGTNVLALATGLDFHFAYGTDSALRHTEESARLGLEVSIIKDSPWCFDVDEPQDRA